jgi:hypothetical protein
MMGYPRASCIIGLVAVLTVAAGLLGASRVRVWMLMSPDGCPRTRWTRRRGPNVAYAPPLRGMHAPSRATLPSMGIRRVAPDERPGVRVGIGSARTASPARCRSHAWPPRAAHPRRRLARASTAHRTDLSAGRDAA